MKNTSLGISFKVNDLDASYEVLGTSDNYSFQENLGKGFELVDQEGEEAKKSISLKGNYGVFEVRVFAVSDIGVRSEFIVDDVEIIPPTFDGTFTFNNLRIDSIKPYVVESIETLKSPESPGDDLRISQQFIGKNIDLRWELIPPEGHPLQGESVSTELLSDTFFSGFRLNIKSDSEVISEYDLNLSAALENSLLTSNVYETLQNYRAFNLELDQDVFNDLGLGRSVDIEIVAVDKFGQTSTGSIEAYSSYQYIYNFEYEQQGKNSIFNWGEYDSNYSGVVVKVLSLDDDNGLKYLDSIDNNAAYFEQVNQVVDLNSQWSNGIGKYHSGDKVLYEGYVYEAIQDHESQWIARPTNEDFWVNIGGRRNFTFEQFEINKYELLYSQDWAKNYFYSFQVYDEFGPGEEQMLGINGTLGDVLYPYKVDVRLGDLTYYEREDDIVFEWKIFDEDDNVVDLNRLVNYFVNTDVPSILGVSGSLRDFDTNDYISGLTEGNNSVGLDQGLNLIYNLPSTKIFDRFVYSREINNAIYGTGGFPDDYQDYDPSVFYYIGDKVIVDRSIYSKKSQYYNKPPHIRPKYDIWSANAEYSQGDAFEFDQEIYEVLEDFSLDQTEGFFDFETDYQLDDIVVAPIVRFLKYYPKDISVVVADGAPTNISFQTNILNKVNSYFKGLIATFNSQSVLIDDYDGSSGKIYLTQALDQTPQSGDQLIVSGFEYRVGDLVLHDDAIYVCLSYQEGDSIEEPSVSSEKWRRVSPFLEIECSLYQLINESNIIPSELTDGGVESWRILNPSNQSNYRKQVSRYQIGDYTRAIKEWNNYENFFSGDLVVYENDIWSGIKDSGPDYNNDPIPTNGDSWVNNINGQDIYADYSQSELVYYNGSVYQAMSSNPVGFPLVANNQAGQSSNSTFEGTQWMPFWQLNNQYDSLIFDHPGIPQSGKRNIGIEIGLIDISGRVISKVDLKAENPAPVIDSDNFIVNINSESESVKFDFDYLLDFQEKVSKVYLYRDSDPNFSIVGEDGFPLTGSNTPFVKSFIGAGDAVFGQNVNTVIDYPPIPYENDYPKYVRINQEVYEKYIFDTSYQGQDINSWGENHWETEGQSLGLSMPTKKTVTGHYYKLLPFDDFGSGVAHTVRNDQGDSLVNVVPKDFHNKDPFSSNGPVVRANPNAAEGAVPSAITDFRGDTIFENFILNWSYIDNDIDFFEVWTDREDFQGDRSSLITGNDLSSTGFLEQANNTGYRRIDGPIYEIGDVSPRESVDEAWKIRNAKWLFDVSVTSNNIEAMYPGATNQERNFWVRAVDMAGNKGPFTGAHINQGDSISGLSLKLEPATATDVADFEIRMTEKFSNTVALVPNNPFEDKYNGTSDITWSEHYLFNQGTGYIVSGSFGATSNQYIWWDKNDSEGNLKLSDYYVKNINGVVEKYNGHNLDNLLEFQVDGQDTLKNIYFSGVSYSGSHRHPAGSDNETNKIDDFDDGDFIIARNTNGITTVVNHAFANALIGTANIAEASIIDAQIDNLKANKILAETISGQDIQVWGLEGQEGAIRTRGFTGVDHSFNDGQKGFLLSGDGSFAFQGGDSSLSFEDNILTLRGKLRQTSNYDYDFIDLNVAPGYFNYIEAEEGFVLEDDSSVSIEAVFRNSTLTDSDSDKIYFKLESIVNGESYPVFDYGESVKDQIVSGFHYHTFQRKEDGTIVARATLDGGFLPGANNEGFHDIITNPVAGVTGDAVVLYVSGANSTYERSATISRVIDGKIGADAKSIRIEAESLVFKEDKDDGSISPNRIKLIARYQNINAIINWTETKSDGSSQSGNLYSASQGGQPVPTGQEVYLDKAALYKGRITITAESGGFSDTITVVLVKDGSNNVQAVLSNESHTLTELSDGTFDLSGSGTEIQVFDGVNALNFNQTVSSESYPTNAGFNVEISAIGVTAGSVLSTTGSAKFEIDDLSPTTNSAGSITFTIYAKKQNGETVSLTKVQSFAVSKFGANGVMGVSPTYRGEYDSSKRYYFLESTENEPGRGDIVEYTDGLYYICTQTHGGGISPNPNAQTPGDPSDFWRSFDAQFENVATDLLLTKEAFVTTTLTVGETNPADGPASYFKFDANAGRLDMRGAVVNNTIAEDVGSQLDTARDGSPANDSDFSIATFVGGGYGNEIVPFSISEGGYQSLASSVVGGAYNAITGRFSFIGNGFENACGDNFSAIVGGYQNTMPKVDSANQGANFIGAGQNNTINGGTNQSILGGSDNTIENL